MYHAMGQASYCSIFPKRGTPVYMMPKFDFVEVLKNIERYRITRLVVVPPIAVLLAKHPAAKQYDLSSIQSILSGAAPLSRAVSAEVEDLWPARNVNLKASSSPNLPPSAESYLFSPEILPST
jgi:4-coumarate--CoA ligase